MNKQHEIPWRKGYPSKEMIGAHKSRLWLMKRNVANDQPELPLEVVKLEFTRSCDMLLEQKYYYSKSQKKIILEEEDYSIIEEYHTITIWENGYFEITDYHGDSIRGIAKNKDDSPIKRLGKFFYKKKFVIEDVISDIEEEKKLEDFILEAESVIGFFYSMIEPGKTKIQKDPQWEDVYFCPIDEDGNKIVDLSVLTR